MRRFPPLGPPPPLEPLPVPAATAAEPTAPNGIRVVSLCQCHMSIFRVNYNFVNFRKREYIYFKLYVYVVAPPPRPPPLARASFDCRPFPGKIIGGATCLVDVVTVARGLRRTTHWMPSWWVKHYSNILLNVFVSTKMPLPITSITRLPAKWRLP